MAEHINLLWTGGWDSTLRLLQLLLIEKKRVQPHYIIIGTRKSTPNEIAAMDRIRKHLINKHPFVKNLLLETQYISDSALNTDEEISEAYATLKKQNHIGQQYSSLANIAKQYEFTDFELCIESGEFANNFVIPFLYVNNSVQAPVYRISKTNTPNAVEQLFSYYTFPLVKLSKEEMIDYVKKQNWINIMNMTWLCHRPILGRYPCGACNPCRFAILDGMSWRVPLPSRLIGGTVKKVFNSNPIVKCRNILKKF